MASISNTGQQHVDYYRKALQRKRLLRLVDDGPAYLPYCGDGDLALDLYAGRELWAADLDPERVEVFRSRFPEAKVIVGDCDAWPFVDPVDTRFAVCDFDAYAYPYESFRSWLANTGGPAEKCLLLFTDGQRQAILRTGHWRSPDGARQHTVGTNEKRQVYNAYWSRTIRPWFQAEAKARGWRILSTQFYTRGMSMLYWGAVIRP